MTKVFWERISFTEATVFCLYTKLSKHDSCTQFYLINSYLHSGFNFNIQKKFVMCGVGCVKVVMDNISVMLCVTHMHAAYPGDNVSQIYIVV